MNTRRIPTSVPALVAFGRRALSTAQKREVELGLGQNTVARLSAEYAGLVGEPGPNPAVRGAEADWQLKGEELKHARAGLRTAIAAAREFWSDAVDLLKMYLGRTWNPAWEAAGFTGFSLATARGNPLPMLLRIRGYLRDHPARENAPLEITAARADAHVAAIHAAEHAVDAAAAASKAASAARSASIKRLRKRLTGLRQELEQLLDDSDLRWHEFGFSRPIDRATPEPVTELVATPGLPGQVLVQHAASARAIDYRVSWKIQGAAGEPTVAGLFADLAVPLSELPSGAAIVISVTARNRSGETPPTEVTVVVP